jgi:hypothetical protein
VLVLLAIVYICLLGDLYGLTGSRSLDGSIGVMLGLYICSHPAANAIDILFFERGALRELAAEWSGIGWLALNLRVLLSGWLVIAMGAAQLAR